MKEQRFKSFFLSLLFSFVGILLPLQAFAQNKKAYAVLSEDGKTCTFRYDEQAGSYDTKMVRYYGTLHNRYIIPASIEKVIFEPSFKAYRPKSTAELFHGCYNLNKIDGIEYLNTEDVTHMGSMFYDCSSLKEINLSNFNTGQVTNMSDMFSGCESLTSLDLSNFNTGQVTNMGDMFNGCSSLTSLNLANFNTSKVKDMSDMFSRCKSLTSIDLSNFNTGQVTSMWSMFNGCSSLTSLNLANFNTKQVIRMIGMFQDCSSLRSLNVSSFNTGQVLNMNSMFYNCSSLTSLNLSHFNTKQVTDMRSMFNGCSSLTSLDLSNFKTEQVTDMSAMFYGCSSLKSLDLSNFNTGQVTEMRSMFNGCSSLTSLNLSNFNTKQVTNMWGMFHRCSSLTSLNLSNFNTEQVTSMADMFNGCSSLKSLNLSNFNSGQVTNMNEMFDGCSSLTSLNLANFNTKQVTDMGEMFDGCSSLTSLDLSNFNTGQATNMWGMFYRCSSLTSLNLSNFNTEQVTDMGSMFNGCSSLTSLDLSNFNAGQATNTSGMFWSCSNLQTIFCRNSWETTSNLFNNNPKLKGAVAYNPEKREGDMANPHTGYFTMPGKKVEQCDMNDVPSTSPYYASTSFLCERGVLSGVKIDGAVKVEDKLTRAQLAKIGFRGLYLTNGRQVPSAVPSDNFPSIYPDISHRTADNEYYYQAARALMYLEYGDGISPFDRNRVNFEPSNNISHIHVLKALCETFNIKPDLSGTSNPFPGDAEAVALQRNNPVKFGYLRRAAALGLVATPEGNKNTKFRPHDDCLRGEAFLMLARIMKAIEAGKIADPNPSTADYFEPLNLTTQTLALGLGLSMGNFNHYTKSSFQLDGVTPLTFDHTYNSYNTTLPDAFYASRDSKDRTEVYQPLGPGWSHSYHTFITFAGHGKDARAIVHWGGGKYHVYQSDGTKFHPESVGVYDDMTITSDGITIRTKDKMTYAFDKQGTAPGMSVLYLTSATDRNGNRLSLHYAEGMNGARVISSVSDGHRELKFTYKNGTNLLEQVEDPSGRSVRFGYTFNAAQDCYVLTSFTDAAQHTTNYEYADAGNRGTAFLLKRIQLPKGNYIENEYDANRRLKNTAVGGQSVPRTQTSVSVAADYKAQAATQSTVTVQQSDRPQSFVYNYNSNNVLIDMKGAGGYSLQATYANARHPQLPTKVKTQNEEVSDVDYDERGNVTRIAVRSLDGDETLETRMAYDNDNNLISTTDAKGNTTRYTYDTAGNMTRIDAPEGATTHIELDNRGLPTKITGAEGVETTISYNEFGNPTRIAQPATGEFTALEYSTLGFLHSVADALGNKTYYWYNNVGNLQTISEELSGRINYQYDDNDNLTLVADEYGNKTSITYDETTDLLVSMSYGKETKRYEYYEDGRLKRYTSPDRLNFDYTYDEQGNVTADGTNNYTYDAHSRLTSVVQDEKQLSFTYDGFNRITGIRYNDFSNNEVHYRYDANGKTTDLTYPDGKNVHYDYDGLNRLTAMTDWKGRTIRYSYDRDSRLTRTDYPNGMHTTYAYDAGGRLAQKKTVLRNSTTVAGYDFEYDLRGNIKKQLSTEPYEAADMPNETTEYLYWGTNQLSRVDNADVLFDQNGNMMWGAGKYKSWDKNNRLVGIGDTQLQYDPLGNLRRYKNTNFLLDLSGIGHIIGEADDEGHPTRYYLHGTNLEARIARDGSTQYYVTDVRGSIVAMVDEAGNLTHRYQYDEFGNITQQEERDFNPFRYIGAFGVLYLEDNLYYMRARVYDSQLGRFLSEDPVWSPNLYPYADNNPIMKIDPKGEFGEVAPSLTRMDVIFETKDALRGLFETVKGGKVLIQNAGHAAKTVTENFGNLDAWLEQSLKGIDSGVRTVAQSIPKPTVSPNYWAAGVKIAGGVAIVAASTWGAAKLAMNGWIKSAYFTGIVGGAVGGAIAGAGIGAVTGAGVGAIPGAVIGGIIGIGGAAYGHWKYNHRR
nr:BspA family leucine-rich repeat surface protein [uncultured Prevotella sp.]